MTDTLEDRERTIRRVKECVCKFCGGPLEVRLIILNQYGGQGIDSYCPSCGKIEIGIEPEFYKIAKDFVDSFEFNYYTDMVEDKRNHQMNVAKIGEIGAWFIRKYQSNTEDK